MKRYIFVATCTTPDFNHHLTGVRKLDGVGDQIQQDLPETRRIGMDAPWYFWVDAIRELKILFMSFHAHGPDRNHLPVLARQNRPDPARSCLLRFSRNPTRR